MNIEKKEKLRNQQIRGNNYKKELIKKVTNKCTTKTKPT
jgi:hypothetical protein